MLIMARRTDELIIRNLVLLQPTDTLALLVEVRALKASSSKYGVFILISF